MKNIYLEKIEYYKIIDLIKGYSKTLKAKNDFESLKPMQSKKDIIKALDEVSEAVSLLYRKGTPPILELENIEQHILNLKNSNFLSIKSILEITNLLITSRLLKEYYFENPLNQTEVLTAYFDHLYTNLKIEETIKNSIVDENTLDDRASAKLNQIRQKQRNIKKEVTGKLQSLLSSKYLQEPIVTIRQGRFVVPVKVEYVSEIKGLVHDTSSSGSTVFIEPMSVFELNNTLSDLKNQEQIEIEIILQKLSSLFFEITDELENTYNLVSLLDFIFAKAMYAKENNCNMPIISDEKRIVLKDAKHPLISKDTVVPISLEVGKDYTTLLITGPNTGGKTVTLKTVGLLTALALSGIHIPAAEGSYIYPFDNIFVDIGDEQNILESLSTFSSHIKNIINILKDASKDSLVLIDELGSGTDPVEGSSLAIAILDELKLRQTITLATTHYQELKEYALVTDKVSNASCEFDLETLSPTFKLLIGVPGKSNAFAISKKLGLDESILDRAKNLVEEDTAKIEDLLKEVYDQKALLEKQNEEIRINNDKIKSLKEDLEKEYTDFESNKKEYIQKAKQDARQILLDAKDEANEIIKEMTLTSDGKELNKKKRRLDEKLKEVDSVKETEENFESLDIENIKPDTIVYVPKFGKNGTILGYPNRNGKFSIQIGSIKTNLTIDQVTVAKKETNKKEIIIKKSTFSPKKVDTELNIIGLNIEESLPLVDKFLDDAALAHLETVRIVHGKGSGVLGKGIQNYLKSHPHSKEFRYGTFGEGEMGVTIVTLK